MCDAGVMLFLPSLSPRSLPLPSKTLTFHSHPSSLHFLLHPSPPLPSPQPHMDGPTATRAIRALGYSGRIFGLTGNMLTAQIDHFMTHGADKVLFKPLDIEAFNRAMTEFAYAQ